MYVNESSTGIWKECTNLGAIQKGVFHLDTGKSGPSMGLSDVVHLNELPRLGVRRPEVANLSGADEIVQCTHRLLEGGFIVGHMDQENIDIVGLKTAEAVCDLIEDSSSGESTVVNVVALVFQFWAEVAGDRRWIFVID